MMLELDDLTHQYGNERAVADVSFGVENGELVALLGPSGCGKTTIVQAIAGHVRPTGGRITLRSEDVTDAPPETRNVGLVFQQPTLYPHMTVRENVEYGLNAQGIGREKQVRRADEYLDLVDLGDQYDAYPTTLSGGQQRRVELARALAPRPDVLLLDEPLSALDRTLRERLREEIARIQRETNVTTLFVTHDQEEAMALADRLVVMNYGGISGVGHPRSLYESPPTPFIASFLGRSNTLSGTVVDHEPLTVELGDCEITVKTARTYQTGSQIYCQVRPEDLSIHLTGEVNDTPSMEGTVTRVTDIGKRYDVTVQTDRGEELLIEHTDYPPAVGTDVTVLFRTEDLSVFDDTGIPSVAASASHPREPEPSDRSV